MVLVLGALAICFLAVLAVLIFLEVDVLWAGAIAGVLSFLACGVVVVLRPHWIAAPAAEAGDSTKLALILLGLCILAAGGFALLRTRRSRTQGREGR